MSNSGSPGFKKTPDGTSGLYFRIEL